MNHGNHVKTLGDPSEISCKDRTRFACISEYLQEACKNGIIVQVQKSLKSFLKESCKETSDILNRYFLQEKRTNYKFLVRICQDLAFHALFARFLQFLQEYCIILQVLARNFQEPFKFCLIE